MCGMTAQGIHIFDDVQPGLAPGFGCGVCKMVLA